MDLLNVEQTYDFTEQMFQAYYDCRKNKRNTINALKFEKHFEQNLFELIEENEMGKYKCRSVEHSFTDNRKNFNRLCVGRISLLLSLFVRYTFGLNKIFN